MSECIIKLADVSLRLKGSMLNDRFTKYFSGFNVSGMKADANLEIIPVGKHRLHFNRIKSNLEADKTYVLGNRYGNIIFNLDSLEGKFYLSTNKIEPEEFSSILIYFYNKLLDKFKGITIHACAILKDKDAFLFLGGSGSGKTTIALLSKDCLILSDEIVAIRGINNRFFAYRTPWCSNFLYKKIDINRDLKGQIKHAFFLIKDKEVFFENLTPAEAMTRFISDKFCFPNVAKYRKESNLNFIQSFFKNIPAKLMHFRKDKSFWLGIGQLMKAHEF